MRTLARNPESATAGRLRTIASTIVSAAAAALVVATAWSANPPTTDRSSPRVTLRARLGIIYAQNGQRTQAREEFVKLMEEPRGRAAALTNLGNLDFLDGKADLALESYKQAGALDGKDAGILLNLGLALHQVGQNDAADKAFHSAVEMAGGVEQASYLLGINGSDDAGRGKVSKMTADEVRQMLLKARSGVPAANGATKANGAQVKVTSRPGGARAAEVAVGIQNLYWKDR